MTTSPLLPQEAARELLRRRRIRSSFGDWCEYRGFHPAAHHRLIIDEIEAFLASDDEVLLLFAPPGSAKSTYLSVLFPPWYLARYPGNSILAATHSIEFAERWGRRVRNDIALEGPTLGIALADDNKAAARWALQSGGEYYGVGAGTGISGFRADLGMGDDFFGSREDAYSETVRRKRWDWYVDDFSARLKPGAKRILMNTRWHEEDVAGHVLDQIRKGIIKGRVISIAAIAEVGDPLGRKPGEYLWDDDPDYRYGDFLRARQRETSPMMWSALYQQRPAPEEGDYFKADWLKTYTKLPPRSEMRVYGGSDYATTADGGDYTVHIVVGLDPEGRMYVLDLWRKQASSDVWVDAFCDLVLEHRPLGWAEEGGQIKAGVGPFLERRQRERKAYVHREPFPTRHDKAVRAQSIRGRMAIEGLYLPESASWVSDFRSELLTFPAGKHDDQCLAEDTLITMADGARKPLAQVAAGDLVATHLGPQAVIASRVTSEAAQVYRMTFSDGRSLTATRNHPIYVENKGFVRVDALSIMDQIVTDLEPLSCAAERQKPKSWNTAAIAAIGLFSRSGRSTANTVRKPAVCVIGIEVLSERAKVRNLTVANAHTFFANGVLTHNCDALGLIGQLLDTVVYGTKPKEKPKAERSGYKPVERSSTGSLITL